MGTYRCDMMSGDEVDKLLAIAIAAVLIEESAGLSIRPSEGRREGCLSAVTNAVKSSQSRLLHAYSSKR